MKAKKSRGSSVQGRRAAAKGGDTSKRRIDYSDIPELTDAQLASMKRVGRPPLGDAPRKAVSIRLDQGVLEWIKRRAAAKDQPYQSLINEILARAMRRAG